MTSPLGTSESLYDLSENQYTFTINVSTKKYINKKKWCEFTHDEQKKHIINNLDFVEKHYELKSMYYVFETTKQGMIHAHGIVTSNDLAMIMVQRTIHDQLGLPRIHPDIVFKYARVWRDSEGELDPSGFINYMAKAQSPEAPPDIDFVD